jgi:hypothetical protein
MALVLWPIVSLDYATSTTTPLFLNSSINGWRERM